MLKSSGTNIFSIYQKILKAWWFIEICWEGPLTHKSVNRSKLKMPLGMDPSSPLAPMCLQWCNKTIVIELYSGTLVLHSQDKVNFIIDNDLTAFVVESTSQQREVCFQQSYYHLSYCKWQEHRHTFDIKLSRKYIFSRMKINGNLQIP